MGFYYCYSKDAGWRKNNKGIDDDELVLVDDTGQIPEEVEKVNQLRVACCLNLAACKMKTAKCDEAVKACDEAIKLDPKNIKALYRRAKARIQPTGSTAYDTDCAIKDLTKASALDPNDTTIREMLARLRVERSEQRAKDRDTFTGMFERGEIYDKLKPRLIPSEGEAAEEKGEGEGENEEGEEDSLEKRIADAELLRDAYMSNGKEDQAKELNERIQQSKKYLKGRDKQQEQQERGLTGHDWSNPTPEMIEDAKKSGIDLNNPEVRAELMRLEREGLPSDEGDGSQPGQGQVVDEDWPTLPPEIKDGAPVPWSRYVIFFFTLAFIMRLLDSLMRNRKVLSQVGWQGLFMGDDEDGGSFFSYVLQSVGLSVSDEF